MIGASQAAFLSCEAPLYFDGFDDEALGAEWTVIAGTISESDIPGYIVAVGGGGRLGVTLPTYDVSIVSAGVITNPNNGRSSILLYIDSENFVSIELNDVTNLIRVVEVVANVATELNSASLSPVTDYKITAVKNGTDLVVKAESAGASQTITATLANSVYNYAGLIPFYDYMPIGYFAVGSPKRPQL